MNATPKPEDLRDRLAAKSRELGFDWFGVAPSAHLEKELQDLSQWLAEGRHGDMAWLAKEPERRTDPHRVLEGCRSVIILGLNYLRGDTDEPPPSPGHGRISKYARARDYHRVIEKLLRKLDRAIGELAPGSSSRAMVDYGPLMERPWAARAGLGFIGKHTLLIHPRQGSFHFLAAILTTADVAPTQPDWDGNPGCGDCTRCIDACPTQAITGPWRFDARQCLSYLTIEKTGPVAEENWPNFENYVFGCDICQDVCPYNRTRALPASQDSPLGPTLVPAAVPLRDLIASPGSFLANLGETASPLRRAGEDSLSRNAAIVASQNGTPEDADALRQLAADNTKPDWLRDTARRALVLLNAPDRH